VQHGQRVVGVNVSADTPPAADESDPQTDRASLDGFRPPGIADLIEDEVTRIDVSGPGGNR
jgi:hypothetical protein